MAGGASEIKLSYEILEEKVTELNTLLSECDGLDMATETPVGGGEYLTFVTQIDEAYADIRSAMSALISNSASFFTNVANSMREADQESADKIGG